MSGYHQVSEALTAGADPHMLCETCPWDRNCINPPTMTAAEVAAKTADPPEGKPRSEADLTKGLLNIMMFTGKDTSAQVCPVLAVELRTAEGRNINDVLRERMLTRVR